MSFCGHLCQKKRIPGKTPEPREILRLSAFIDQERQLPWEKPEARNQALHAFCHARRRLNDFICTD
jgi:hypothetical protein